MIEVEGQTHVAAKLFNVGTSHGGFGPKGPIDGLLRTLNNLAYYVKTSDIKPCDPNAYMAIVRASLATREIWSAEGTPWSK